MFFCVINGTQLRWDGLCFDFCYKQHDGVTALTHRLLTVWPTHHSPPIDVAERLTPSSLTANEMMFSGTRRYVSWSLDERPSVVFAPSATLFSATSHTRGVRLRFAPVCHRTDSLRSHRYSYAVATQLRVNDRQLTNRN